MCISNMKHNIYFFVMVGFFSFFFSYKTKIFPVYSKTNRKKIGDFILTWGMRSNYFYLRVLIDNTNIWRKKRRFNANITVHTNKLIAKNVPYAKGSLNNNLLNCDSNFHKKEIKTQTEMYL